MRVHRMTWVLAVAVALAASFACSAAARARDDNEAQLLDRKANELTFMIDSLAMGYEANVASVAAIASATAGDEARFRTAAAAAGADVPGAGWLLLHRSDTDGISVVARSGEPALPTDDPSLAGSLEAAFAGDFVVVGFQGTGTSRSIDLAAGAPGGAGDWVAFAELPLFSSTSAANAASTPDTFRDIEAAFYLDEVGPEHLVFGIGAPHGRVATASTEIGPQRIVIEVSTTVPLSGHLTQLLPWVLLLTALAAGVVGVVAIEQTLRRRDEALAVAGALTEKNAELDAALAARDRVEEERRRLEGELRQTQRLEAVGQLAGGIAHDFNNLLAAILSYADLLHEDLGDHPSRADVDEIRDAARRGATLTRKLLVFSRGVPGREEQVDVAAVVEDVQRLLARTIGEDVALRTELLAGLPPARLDAGALEQVVMNLVVNARDALEGRGPKGEIAVGVDLAVDLDARYVRLRVTDNGPGMDEAVALRAFEPFFTTKERGRGTGLGLSTVYGIVQRAGGRVRIDSAPGAGTTVEVLLPEATAPAAVDPTAGGRAATGAPATGTVLLVEDEEPVRRAAKRMLERRGFVVLEARDGVEAIELFSDARPDVLLTDVILPGGLTGADVAEAFGRRRRGLPVVFMSGYSSDILARRGLDAGVDTLLLSKPFDEPALLAVVQDALAARAAR